MTSLRSETRAIRVYIVQVSLLCKVFQNLQPKQQEKALLNYRSASRNSPPNIVQRLRHLTRLNKFEVDSDRFENYQSCKCLSDARVVS